MGFSKNKSRNFNTFAAVFYNNNKKNTEPIFNVKSKNTAIVYPENRKILLQLDVANCIVLLISHSQ